MPKIRQSKPIWFGMKLTPQQKQQIRLLARQRHTSAKQALMELVEEALAQRSFKAPQGSFLDGLEDLVGSVSGPADLSANPEYMKDFGR
ncbi:MAG: hypothetical protein HYW07_17360 [Candidatus Latescibacteria bacterium]|nr:hypothetical protein [Candidatus Latescibacterota bacterium]